MPPRERETLQVNARNRYPHTRPVRSGQVDLRARRDERWIDRALSSGSRVFARMSVRHGFSTSHSSLESMKSQSQSRRDPDPSRDRVTNGNEDDLNAPSRACNTPAPRRSKRPTCDREPRPRTRVKPVRRFPRRGRACVSRRSRERGDRPRGARGGAIEGRENRRHRPRVPRARR